MSVYHRSSVELRKASYELHQERLDNAINNGRCQRLREMSPNNDGGTGRFFRPFNECKVLMCTLLFSMLVICGKILYASRNFFYKLFSKGRSIIYSPFSVISFDTSSKFFFPVASLWSFVLNLSWLFIPALVGLATTYITWRVVYLNSAIPGVEPASPFSSEQKGKKIPFMMSNGYMFALYVGIIVFLVLVFT